MNQSTTEEGNVIENGDKLFSDEKYQECIDILKPYENDVEVLWRLARANYELGMTEKEKKRKMNYLIAGTEYVTRAMNINNKHYAIHLYTALLSDEKTTLEGLKSRANNVPSFYDHMMIAIELNPKDFFALQVMGIYCYFVADLPWYIRKVTQLLFRPPESSFEEALTYFIKAKDLTSTPSSYNDLWLGKTYLKLKQIDLGRHHLQVASESEPCGRRERESKEEAIEIIKKGYKI